MGINEIIENFANNSYTNEELKKPMTLGEMNYMRINFISLLKRNDDRIHAVIRAHNKEKDKFIKTITATTASNEKRSMEQSRLFHKILKEVQEISMKQAAIESNQDLLLSYMQRILKSSNRDKWHLWEDMLKERYEENKTNKLLKRIKALSKTDQKALSVGAKLMKKVKEEALK